MEGWAEPASDGTQPPRIGTVRYPRLVPRDADCAAKLKKRTLTNLYNQRGSGAHLLCDILVKVFVRGQRLPRWHELHGEDGDEAAEEHVAQEDFEHGESPAQLQGVTSPKPRVEKVTIEKWRLVRGVVARVTYAWRLRFSKSPTPANANRDSVAGSGTTTALSTQPRIDGF